MTSPTPHTPYDPAQLEEVFLKVRHKLKAILAFHRIPPEDAEDIIQEAIVVTILRWDSIVDLESWLFGALRIRFSLYRRSKQLLRRYMETVSPQVLDAIVESELPPQERDDMLREIHRASFRLGHQHQAILRLRYRLGYSVAEIAERLGYRPSSVRKLAARAITRIRHRLDLAPAADPKDAKPDRVGSKPAYPPE
jgi:RNA polymerase sigma factor (sigma-70 family)